MDQSEIEAIRKLLISKPRPVGWIERRQRLDEVGSVWPVADDVNLVSVDAGGVAGEWSNVPVSDPSRVLLFFHGGGYCSGSIPQPSTNGIGGRPGGKSAHASDRLPFCS